MSLSSSSQSLFFRLQPPHLTESMAGTAHSSILTVFPATTSSFRCRHSLFLASHSLPSAVKPLTFRSVGCVARRQKLLLVRACSRSHQISGDGSEETTGLSWAQPILRFARSNILPFALVSAVTLGLACPSLGCAADKYSVSKIGPFGIFVISGLVLRSEEIGAAIEAWPAGLFGLVSILFLTPYFSRIILQIQLQPQEFITGLAIFSCMPTTLSSGVALTQLAGGNSALALAMTVISNLLGILIIPVSISKFVADGVGVALPTKQLFKSLLLTILFPLILGKVLRESFKGVADFVDGNRKLFSGISAFFLSLVPWIQVSRSRSLLLMVKPRVFLVAIGLGTLLHLSLLVFNSIAVRSLSVISGGSKSLFSREENANAVILVASQKTLPVMVAVIEPLKGAFGESGLLVLPCVAAHLIQQRKMMRQIAAILLIGIVALAYQAINPPPTRTCGSEGGPPITAQRIKLRDGRHLAYKEHGVPRQLAKNKVVFLHGFGSTRHDAVIATHLPLGLLEELGAYIVSFDRAGYGESDPDPNRTMKSLALDVEELADKLELGSKFYVMGFSMGGQAVWGCLKFIPHRLAGATLINPVINYWWPSLPSNLSKKAYKEQPTQDQWAVGVAHYVPWLTYWWFTQNWFPSSSVVQGNPNVFSPQDLSIISNLVHTQNRKEEAQQQGVAESICRDAIIGFGSWDFDPIVDVENPFPDNNSGHVHLWQGDDDRLVPVMLQRYIAQKIPWIHYHELPGSGHLFPFLEHLSADILKTQFAG